jgi:FkbM family methyltransferase
MPALREIENARRLLVAADKRLRETIQKLPDSPRRGRLIQERWTVLQMLGHNRRFFSQAGQDEFLDRVVFRGRRGGVFVEIGAYDGITGSNSLFFEIFRGWSGLLIEASPTLHAEAQKFRNTPCLQVAVAPEAGFAEFLDLRRGYVQMGGLIASLGEMAKKAIEADPRTVSEVIRAPTRPLADILADQRLSRIDYVSIDIEGGELVRWGLENLNLTAERLKQLGFGNELQPIKVSCADHEGTRTGRIQTWDGKKWNIVSGWITADDSIIAPMVKEAAAKYAAEKKITTGCVMTN